MSRGYVVGFAGRRDGYQVPLALAEAGLLDRFVTTFYLTPAIKRMLPKMPGSLRSRRVDGLPPERVEEHWGLELLEQVGRRIGLPAPSYWSRINAGIGKAVADAAERTGSNVLAYEPYAPQAFRREYSHRPKRVLFHFHPHPALEAAVYADDLRRHPPARPWQSHDAGGRAPDASERAVQESWRLADTILCASSFTSRSLVYAGADEARCKVIPYGVEAPEEVPGGGSQGRFAALFVGTGLFRKGLHHLLKAWTLAKLPADSELTLVCRTLDPQLRDLAAATPRCRWIPGVPGEELERLYRSASLLAVPSLVEGFGQVYLEALAQGCPVLGTANTCLPDLGGEADGAFLAPVGDPDALAHQLEELAVRLPHDPDVRSAAWATARRFPWRRFRAGVVEAVR